MDASFLIAVVVIALSVVLAMGGLFIIFAAGILWMRGRNRTSDEEADIDAPTEEAPRPAKRAPAPMPAPAPAASSSVPDPGDYDSAAPPAPPPGLAGASTLGATPLGGGIKLDPEADSAATEVFTRPTPGQALWEGDDDDAFDEDKTELFTPGMLANFDDDELGMLMDDTPAPAPRRDN